MAFFCGRNVLATWCQCLQDRDSSSCNPFCSSAVAVSAPWSNRHHNWRPNLPRMAATLFRCFGVLNFCVAWQKLFTKPNQAPRVVSSCQRMHMDFERVLASSSPSPKHPSKGPCKGKTLRFFVRPAFNCVIWVPQAVNTDRVVTKKRPFLFCYDRWKFWGDVAIDTTSWVSWYLATSVLSVSDYREECDDFGIGASFLEHIVPSQQNGARSCNFSVPGKYSYQIPFSVAHEMVVFIRPITSLMNNTLLTIWWMLYSQSKGTSAWQAKSLLLKCLSATVFIRLPWSSEQAHFAHSGTENHPYRNLFWLVVVGYAHCFVVGYNIRKSGRDCFACILQLFLPDSTQTKEFHKSTSPNMALLATTTTKNINWFELGRECAQVKDIPFHHGTCTTCLKSPIQTQQMLPHVTPHLTLWARRPPELPHSLQCFCHSQSTKIQNFFCFLNFVLQMWFLFVRVFFCVAFQKGLASNYSLLQMELYGLLQSLEGSASQASAALPSPTFLQRGTCQNHNKEGFTFVFGCFHLRNLHSIGDWFLVVCCGRPRTSTL